MLDGYRVMPVDGLDDGWVHTIHLSRLHMGQIKQSCWRVACSRWMQILLNSATMFDWCRVMPADGLDDGRMHTKVACSGYIIKKSGNHVEDSLSFWMNAKYFVTRLWHKSQNVQSCGRIAQLLWLDECSPTFMRFKDVEKWNISLTCVRNKKCQNFRLTANLSWHNLEWHTWHWTHLRVLM